MVLLAKLEAILFRLKPSVSVRVAREEVSLKAWLSRRSGTKKRCSSPFGPYGEFNEDGVVGIGAGGSGGTRRPGDCIVLRFVTPGI